ncbi:MAG: bifunctional YncE family protein/alkaline phosphatase family protein, partial [Bacteroidota bacterium]
MKYSYFPLLLCLLLCSCKEKEVDLSSKFMQENNIERYLLPNSWAISPIGNSLKLGDLPLNMLLSSDEEIAIVSNNGQSEHSLSLIDLKNEKILEEVSIPKAWYGLALDEEAKKLYASGGNDNLIRVYTLQNKSLIEVDSILLGRPWPEDSISVTGLTLDQDNQILYVTTKENNSLYGINLKNKEILFEEALGSEGFTSLLSPDNSSLYISLWGASSVAVFDIETQKIRKRISVGGHPNEMIYSKDKKYLFVACSDDNSVSVLDLKSEEEIEQIVASLYPDAPTGSTTNSLALSEDGDELFIANADNNFLAVFEVEEPGQSKSLGFIPTGWYPTSVRVANGKIWVANGKGFNSAANVKGPNPYESRTDETEYIGSMFKGTLSYFPMPDVETLAIYTQMVYDNTPYKKDLELMAEGIEGNPIPRKVGETSPIKYVFYVIKENRTYDQVFGDIAEGNGEPSLCLFPDSVTPNQHALAREFVLLDNFYVNAEVSADGHNWTMAAYANDYVEKTWPTLYGGRGGTYDYEGTKEVAYPRDGFFWDFCERAGVSFRTYGEFANLHEVYLETLKGHSCEQFPGYDTKIRDVLRFERWKTDFDSLLAINQIPQFNTVRFGNDHTAGLRPGYPTPAAMVADNDLAVGLLVEHISKSSIWKESCIFILEDDAQNGADHVDAHRSIALIASPYTKRKHKESSMYSTSSMLRTMELILGLPPMSQYDAAATPMYA